MIFDIFLTIVENVNKSELRERHQNCEINSVNCLLFNYFVSGHKMCLKKSEILWGGWGGIPQVSSVSECFMLIVSPGQSISPLLVFNISKSSQLLKHCAGNRKVVGLIPRKRGFRSNTDCECAVS